MSAQSRCAADKPPSWVAWQSAVFGRARSAACLTRASVLHLEAHARHQKGGLVQCWREREWDGRVLLKRAAQESRAPS